MTVLALGWSLCASHALSQSSDHERIVPLPVEARPFSTNTTRRTPVYAVEFRSADEISQQDRLVIVDALSSIAEHAGFAGFEFQKNTWAYRQIVCPTFPNHLFLRFIRNNAEGDVSVFSASIPRNGEGRVRIVPILKRSYSLFSPAPINALTISTFNHIRKEEGEPANSDWLGDYLCYAALAGARPAILPADAERVTHSPIPALTAVLSIQIKAHSKEVIRFDDAAARPHAMEWTMTFTPDGKLIKATHRRADTFAVEPVSQKSSIVRTSQVPRSGPD
jgi:hypothetical protein